MALDHAPYLDTIEAELQEIVRAPAPVHAPLYDMMRYHLGWADADGAPLEGVRGKRLRPLLCLLACEAVGGIWERAIPAAAAIELVHNFSLIHDDIEDNSALRHNRSTVWKLWGLAQGINTGDAMWTLARLALYRLRDYGYRERSILRVAQQFDETCLALCHGQHLDISFEGRLDVTQQAYGEMIAGKTAALVAASTRIGALLGDADAATARALGRFGRHLGLAFQLTDDLLGIWGDPAVTGKSAASDLATRKMTLPVIHALAWERQRGESRLHELYGTRNSGDPMLAEILARLEAAGSEAYVRQQAETHQQAMLATLHTLRLNTSAARELERLARGIVERER